MEYSEDPGDRGVKREGFLWWPASYRDLAKQHGISLRQVKSAKRKLVERRLIYCTQGWYRSGHLITLYRPNVNGIISQISALLKEHERLSDLCQYLYMRS
jgi:transcription initiation factor IIE alpha subunit